MRPIKKAILIPRNNGYHTLLLVVILFFLLSTSIIFLSHINSTQGKTTREKPNNSCQGRYIYIQDPPRQFSGYLIDHCETTFSTWTDRDMCPYVINFGMGRQVLEDSQGVLLNGSCWYYTSSFSLSIIFHHRMQRYECLTNDFSLASAVYVPYYAGLDASRYLWSRNLSLIDESALEFVKWIGQTPEWKRMWGREHFIISGRTSWDVRRGRDDESEWGSRLRLLPESINMSMLSVESSFWNNDLAIPYPTCFHPSQDNHILQWQDKIRRQKRDYLFSFAGAQRPDNPTTLRFKLIRECLNASNSCKLLECDYDHNGDMLCDNPVKVIQLFQNSVFCLQPKGDSYTRRSFFDSILAGCVPILFHPASAYVQYKWFLPDDHSKYSIYIPIENEQDWRPGIVIETLLAIPNKRVVAMREEVLGLIPKIIYADPRARLEKFEDAFDVAVQGILGRIDTVRKQIVEGKDPSIDFAKKDESKFDIGHF